MNELMTFCAASDLIDMGRSEDGEALVGRSYFVVATHVDGRRWRLYTGADKLVTEYEEFGPYVWIDPNKDAARKADILATALTGGMRGRDAARDVNDGWVKDVPVYGSEAHDEYARYDADDWAIAARY